MLKVKLRVKLLGAFGGILILLVAVMGVYQYLSSYTTSSFKDLFEEEIAIAEHATSIRTYMLQCRRDEKDFLLRNDKKYLNKLNENVALLKEEAQSIISLATHVNDQTAVTGATAIINHADEYQKAFTALVESWERKGLDYKSGLQGEFRAASQNLADDLEDHEIDELQVALLMMRRYEKDFIITGSDSYRQKFMAAIGSYKKLLETHHCEEKAKKSQQQALALYEKAFAGYLAADQSSKLEAYREMKNQAHNMEDAISQVLIPNGAVFVLDMRKNEKDCLLRDF